MIRKYVLVGVSAFVLGAGSMAYMQSQAHANASGPNADTFHMLELFGDVATKMCIVLDGDEGLFASYSDVQFRAPVRAGDVLEVTATLVKEGTRSRVMDFAVHVVGRGAPTPDAPGRAEVLDPPVVATTATGTVVVPPPTRG